MNILKILQLPGVIGTILTGLISLIWPRKVQGFILIPNGFIRAAGSIYFENYLFSAK